MLRELDFSHAVRIHTFLVGNIKYPKRINAKLRTVPNNGTQPTRRILLMDGDTYEDIVEFFASHDINIDERCGKGQVEIVLKELLENELRVESLFE